MMYIHQMMQRNILVNSTRFLRGSTMRKKIYRAVLKMILQDGDKLGLTGKQKSHIGCLMQKCK